MPSRVGPLGKSAKQKPIVHQILLQIQIKETIKTPVWPPMFIDPLYTLVQTVNRTDWR